MKRKELVLTMKIVVRDEGGSSGLRKLMSALIDMNACRGWELISTKEQDSGMDF